MKKKRKKKAGEDGIKALGVFLMESRNHFVFHSEFEIFGTSRVSLLEIWIDGANFQIINNLILAISFSNSRHLALFLNHQPSYSYTQKHKPVPYK